MKMTCFVHGLESVCSGSKFGGFSILFVVLEVACSCNRYFLRMTERAMLEVDGVKFCDTDPSLSHKRMDLLTT